MWFLINYVSKSIVKVNLYLVNISYEANIQNPSNKDSNSNEVQR
jgi:hypothetical protein